MPVEGPQPDPSGFSPSLQPEGRGLSTTLQPKGLGGGRRLYIAVALIGALTAFLQGLLGIGGGVIIVPALVLVAGFSQKSAQAASLWYVIPTSLLGAVLYRHSEAGSAEFPLLIAMVVPAFVGVLVGAQFVKNISQTKLKQIFGICLIGIALVMIWRADPPEAGRIMAVEHGGALQYVVLVSTGFAAGLFSGLLGIGGGVLVVPALVLLAGFSQKAAQGTSLAYIVPTATFGALLYRFHVRVTIEKAKVALMVGTGLIGITGGCLVVMAIPDQTLRLTFAAALVILAALMVLQARKETTAKAGRQKLSREQKMQPAP